MPCLFAGHFDIYLPSNGLSRRGDIGNVKSAAHERRSVLYGVDSTAD